MLMTPEEQTYNQIKPTLCEVLNRNWLEDSYLSIKARKGYYSILFDRSSVIARILTEPKTIISVPTSALSATNSYSNMADKTHGAYTKIPISSFQEIKQYTGMLQEVLQVIIDRFPKDFDCCSRYSECSDAKRCVHPDSAFSVKCGYRKVLRRGQIFYGKNRNIV